MQVYFIQIGDDGPIKIGKANNPQKRLQHLQSGHPHILNIIHIEVAESEDHALKMEQDFHKKFEEHRIRGEWFRPRKPLLEYVGKAPMTWEKIIAIEPDLKDLYEEAMIAEAQEEDFKFKCPRDHLWYRSFKPRMLHLVGFMRHTPPTELQGTEAYEISYHKICEAMPCPPTCKGIGYCL